MNDPAFIGIDPGKSGAIAVLVPSKNVCSVYDMPVAHDGKKNRYEILALLALLQPCQNCKDCTKPQAICEEVHAMPTNGAVGNFEFGYGLGVMHTVLTALGIPFKRVTPQTWKKHFSLIGKNKEASRLRALELFPNMQEELKLKKHDGRAEALLMAEYLRQTYNGSSNA